MIVWHNWFIRIVSWTNFSNGLFEAMTDWDVSTVDVQVPSKIYVSDIVDSEFFGPCNYINPIFGQNLDIFWWDGRLVN